MHLKDDGINAMNMYRHFKGDYYVVHFMARDEDTLEEKVIYQSLRTGQVWSRTFKDFTSEVPPDVENPTGQKHRFERVVEYGNPLKLATTESLLKELSRRSDNPYDTLDKQRVWREQYLVGRLSIKYLTAKSSIEDFDLDSVWDTYERALSQVMKLGAGFCILKRVLIKQEF